jgi:hypothetical protein
MLVRVRLCRNPKAIKVKPFVARLVCNAEPDSCLEFLRPITQVRAKNGIPIKAEYDLSDQIPYVVRTDESSHQNPRYTYRLVILDGQELKTIASIEFVRDYPTNISPPELKNFYSQYRKPVAALWAFWRFLSSQGGVDNEGKDLEISTLKHT